MASAKTLTALVAAYRGAQSGVADGAGRSAAMVKYRKRYQRRKSWHR